MDPLVMLDSTRERLPAKVYNRIIERYRYVKEGIERIERVSGIGYPKYYIEPSITIAEGNGLGILFARTIPIVDLDGALHIVVEVTAPLVAYALKGTIHAILAHEFLHYLELTARFMRMDVVSDEVSGTLFEHIYADMGRLFSAKSVLHKDRSLLRLIAKRFTDEGFSDARLEDRCIREWIDKGLPVKRISMDENVVKVPIAAIVNMHVDEVLRSKIYELISGSNRDGKGKRRGTRTGSKQDR
jgi:hypothetical protein